MGCLEVSFLGRVDRIIPPSRDISLARQHKNDHKQQGPKWVLNCRAVHEQLRKVIFLMIERGGGGKIDVQKSRQIGGLMS